MLVFFLLKTKIGKYGKMEGKSGLINKWAVLNLMTKKCEELIN